MRAFSLPVICSPVQTSGLVVEHSFFREKSFHILSVGGELLVVRPLHHWATAARKLPKLWPNLQPGKTLDNSDCQLSGLQQL